eukprot:CAMPEP_0174696608 /NCGR_PEP_ID=MMETSP1094-20130205/2710_1 /TAXON_ID=156173 /ORGANISM="Chrysochromulina brevifilum, Strain UTEX LB 985" /LENGTH=103 /DNA_ID=CAMNT_0015893419 /DNA_START=423 /DNA_END=734 /DNA_ORIENTATION=+
MTRQTSQQHIRCAPPGLQPTPASLRQYLLSERTFALLRQRPPKSQEVTQRPPRAHKATTPSFTTLTAPTPLAWTTGIRVTKHRTLVSRHSAYSPACLYTPAQW